MHQQGIFHQVRSLNRPSPGNGSSAAGTKHFTLKKATKAEMLQSRVDELEENRLLKQQLEEKSAAETDGNMEITDTGNEAMKLDYSTESSTNSSTDSSTDSSSDLCSSSTSSEEEKKRKKYKKRSKKTSKKAKRSKGKGERVSTIKDVVRRYRRVLKLIQRGLRMTKAFKKAQVSRNAVKDTAAIAEIYIVDKSVLEQFKDGKHTLLQLAKLCQKKIVGELAEKVNEMKSKKQLIPFTDKKV